MKGARALARIMDRGLYLVRLQAEACAPQIDSQPPAISTINSGQTYIVQLEYVSGELQLTVDGVLLINFATMQPEQGTAGFHIKSTTENRHAEALMTLQ